MMETKCHKALKLYYLLLSFECDTGPTTTHVTKYGPPSDNINVYSSLFLLFLLILLPLPLLSPLPLLPNEGAKELVGVKERVGVEVGISEGKSDGALLGNSEQ